MSYQEEYQASIDDPATFWTEKASQIDWYKPPTNVLSVDENGIDRLNPKNGKTVPPR